MAAIPSSAIDVDDARLEDLEPLGGAYWSARADDSNRDALHDRGVRLRGKVEVSGSPPASEITSSRSVIAIRSRIADDVITFVRAANNPA